MRAYSVIFAPRRDEAGRRANEVPVRPVILVFVLVFGGALAALLVP